jgi:hypothetical protein
MNFIKKAIQWYRWDYKFCDGIYGNQTNCNGIHGIIPCIKEEIENYSLEESYINQTLEH